MTRSARRFSTLAVVLVTTLVASVAPAAVYAPVSDADLLGRAPAAALVRAVASETGILATGLPETRTRFEVIEALRGGLGREVEVGVLGGDLGDGTTLVVPDVPRFEAGRIYLLLLSKRDDGRYSVVEQALGAFDVVQDEAGARFATRLSFAEKKARPVAVKGTDGAVRAELEPTRKLAELTAAIRGSEGALAVEMSSYTGAASGKTNPVRETRGVSAMWDSNWNSQRARWNPSATAAVTACDAALVTAGQGGVTLGGLNELRSAATEWSVVPNQAKGAVINYTPPVDIFLGACPPTSVVNSGQVFIEFDDTTVTGPALNCGQGGTLSVGAWLTDNTSHTWKNESWKTVKAGQGWIRRVDCAVYPSDLFTAVLLHTFGNTLGLSNSDVSQNANDVDPSDNANGVMVSTFGATPPAGLGTDDIDGACWLYGPCGDKAEELQAAFYFPNPWYKGQAVPFADRSRGTPTSWSWTFGDGSTASTAVNPNHTYAAAGRYVVSLTVKRTVAGVEQTATETQVISILTDLVAELSTTPSTVEVGKPVTVGLTITKGKAKSPAQLDFDDGTSAAPTSANGVAFANTVHTFAEPGKYYVRATAQDADDAVAPGVTGPENFVTTTSVVNVYPVACTGPAGAPILTLPLSVRLGNNLFISWTADKTLDPRIDYYEVEVSSIPEFTNPEVFRTGSDYFLYSVTPYMAIITSNSMLYVRVRTVKQCATTLASGYSNVAQAMIERPPAVVFPMSSAASMFYKVGSGDAPPTAGYCWMLAPYSAGSVELALSLTGTDAASFSLDKTTATVDMSSNMACVNVTAKASALATAGQRVAQLVAKYGVSETLTSDVTLLVSTASQPPAYTVLRSAASKLNFSAPTGQTPTPMTLTMTILPPPQAGQSIELQVERRPSWLVVDQPVGGLKFDSNGQLVLTVRVDRSQRDYPGAPQTGDLVLGLALSLQTPLSIPVLDMEPYTVQSGQASTRSVKFEPLGKLDTLDESPGSFFVASAVEAPGLQGAYFSSDGWLRNNTNVDDLPVEFWYTPAGKDGMSDPGVLLAKTMIKANRTLRLSSMLTTVFGLAGGSGMIETRSRFAGALTFRTRTESTTGSDPALLFGAEMPAVSATDGVDASGGEALVPGIVSNSKFRTNLILTNVSREGATVTVKVVSADGLSSGSLTGVNVPPYSRVQIDSVAAAAGFPTLALGSVSAKVTSGGGRVVPVASVVDNASNSFSLVKGRRVGTGAFRALIVPGVVRATGAYETHYQTALNIANGTSTPANLQLVYRYYDLDLAGKSGEAIANVTIPAYGSLPAAKAEDVLSALFGLDGQTYGWIAIEGEAQKVTAAAVISAQIDNANADKGRTAAQLAAIPSTSPAITSVGAQRIRFAGAEKSTVRRSNLVLLETTGAAAAVQAVLTDVTGTVLGVKELALQPFEYRQVNDLFGPALFNLGAGPFSDVDLAVTVKSGSGRVLAFVSTIVNASRNPEIYLLTPSGP